MTMQAGIRLTHSETNMSEVLWSTGDVVNSSCSYITPDKWYAEQLGLMHSLTRDSRQSTG